MESVWRPPERQRWFPLADLTPWSPEWTLQTRALQTPRNLDPDKTQTCLSTLHLSLLPDWSYSPTVSGVNQNVHKCLTGGRGCFTLQLIPPTSTILGMSGRGKSSVKSFLFKYSNSFLASYTHAGSKCQQYTDVPCVTSAARYQSLKALQPRPRSLQGSHGLFGQSANTAVCKAAAPPMPPVGQRHYRTIIQHQNWRQKSKTYCNTNNTDILVCPKWTSL